MQEQDPQLEQMLDAMRERYMEKMPEKFQLVLNAIDRLSVEAWSETVARELHRHLHGLAGSGATFGMPELSRITRELETFVDELMRRRDDLAEEDVRILRDGFDRMKTAAGVSPGEITDAVDMPETYPEEDDLPVAKQHTRIADSDNRLIFVMETTDGTAAEITQQLTNFGYRVSRHVVADALNMTMEQVPAAMIIDIEGAEVTCCKQAVKSLRDKTGIRIPAIFISSREDITNRLGAVRAGGDAYFTAPVNVNDLIDDLDSLTHATVVEPYRILIVEDDSFMAERFAVILRRAGMLVEVVNEPMAVIHALVDFHPDLVLLDVYMPGCSGIELGKVIRQMPEFVSVPIVFLSGETSIERQLDAMSIGGDDFLTKPIRSEHLISSVTNRVKRYRILRSYMERDGLTGLLNHTSIKERIEGEVNRARRDSAPLAFAMVDIDHFKHVNDTYGHPTGDRVLKSLARLLQQRLRRSDVVGRYGGEEFAVLIIGADAEDALRIMDDIREGFSLIRHYFEDMEFTVTFSCGVASLNTRHNDAITLGEAADKALYDAKRSGRNRVSLAP